jgi:hypothetical protein
VTIRRVSSVDRRQWLGASFGSFRDSKIEGVRVFSVVGFAANESRSIVPVQGREKEDIASRRGG